MTYLGKAVDSWAFRLGDGTSSMRLVFTTILIQFCLVHPCELNMMGDITWQRMKIRTRASIIWMGQRSLWARAQKNGLRKRQLSSRPIRNSSVSADSDDRARTHNLSGRDTLSPLVRGGVMHRLRTLRIVSMQPRQLDQHEYNHKSGNFSEYQ